MKPVKLVLIAMLCIISTYSFPQGSGCSGPCSLTLDDNSRMYSSSLSFANPLNCVDRHFIGIGKLPIFSFNTKKENLFDLDTGSIPSGFYYLVLTADNYKKTFSLLKS